jgi:hypothetical protein
MLRRGAAAAAVGAATTVAGRDESAGRGGAGESPGNTIEAWGSPNEV